MKRRHFLALSICVFPYISQAVTVDTKEIKPEAWKASSINDAAIALYGREKFGTIRKSSEVELIVPKAVVRDPENIPITVRSSIKARTVAIFQDANLKSLVAVFHVGEESIIDYEITMRMEFKGTVFAVIEGVDGRLYYAREYVQVLHMSCMASGDE